MAKTIHKDNVVIQYLIVAAVGFVLLFVAHQAVVLVNAPYSPHGLSSISSLGLASYLIFAGIYSSAISVSQDSELRRSIRNFAIRETRLLDSIGSAHMEEVAIAITRATYAYYTNPHVGNASLVASGSTITGAGSIASLVSTRRRTRM
jgi:hypothetical protein